MERRIALEGHLAAIALWDRMTGCWIMACSLILLWYGLDSQSGVRLGAGCSALFLLGLGLRYSGMALQALQRWAWTLTLMIWLLGTLVLAGGLVTGDRDANSIVNLLWSAAVVVAVIKARGLCTLEYRELRAQSTQPGPRVLLSPFFLVPVALVLWTMQQQSEAAELLMDMTPSLPGVLAVSIILTGLLYPGGARSALRGFIAPRSVLGPLSALGIAYGLGLGLIVALRYLPQLEPPLPASLWSPRMWQLYQYALDAPSYQRLYLLCGLLPIGAALLLLVWTTGWSRIFPTLGRAEPDGPPLRALATVAFGSLASGLLLALAAQGDFWRTVLGNLEMSAVDTGYLIGIPVWWWMALVGSIVTVFVVCLVCFARTPSLVRAGGWLVVVAFVFIILGLGVSPHVVAWLDPGRDRMERLMSVASLDSLLAIWLFLCFLGALALGSLLGALRPAGQPVLALGALLAVLGMVATGGWMDRNYQLSGNLVDRLRLCPGPLPAETVFDCLGPGEVKLHDLSPGQGWYTADNVAALQRFVDGQTHLTWLGSMADIALYDEAIYEWAPEKALASIARTHPRDACYGLLMMPVTQATRDILGTLSDPARVALPPGPLDLWSQLLKHFSEPGTNGLHPVSGASVKGQLTVNGQPARGLRLHLVSLYRLGVWVTSRFFLDNEVKRQSRDLDWLAGAGPQADEVDVPGGVPRNVGVNLLALRDAAPTCVTDDHGRFSFCQLEAQPYLLVGRMPGTWRKAAGHHLPGVIVIDEKHRTVDLGVVSLQLTR